MLRHLRRWGAVWLLAVLFASSWAAQLVCQVVVSDEPVGQFWSATFENWQSEWLQLVFQAVFVLGLKHAMFRADAEDLERIDAKLNEILDRVPGRTRQ